MNYSTAIFLINKHARAISTSYETDAPNRPAPRVTFKTLDPEIKVGDLVLVPTHTRHNMTVVKVVEVDVDVDFDGGPQLAWIVGRVDATGYQKTLEQEAVAIAAIRSAETRKKRDALRDAILADQMEAIKALPIAAMNGETQG